MPHTTGATNKLYVQAALTIWSLPLCPDRHRGGEDTARVRDGGVYSTAHAKSPAFVQQVDVFCLAASIRLSHAFSASLMYEKA